MLGYGGGLSAIPLMQKEVVERYSWMDDEAFSDILALTNALPGPVNTKMAGYIGWRLAGFWGMMNALLASFLPTAVLMILLLTVLHAYKDKPWVEGMAKGVMPIAGVMIGVLAWDFVKKSKSGLGWTMTIVYIAISLVVMQLLHIHPAILIAAFIIMAMLSKGKTKTSHRVGEK
ncbi:chromate transporter [Virgibacillus sp. 179-BFC.A HS]|uniref:Chromate transporter n=1 Tax=Tigheibacillus jepli TaxID=3035914 RepID=A0ABU5CF86_9BACI|nr:chromate transporter [Virgibacillus sp. 179-BFC.A HS]MDY0404987.1 chromate transporter [Virgibacillus sp. 179-BFC.A HS]